MAAILFAVLMIVLFGFGAISLDVGNAYWQQRKVQFAADSGALAGALLLADKSVADRTVQLNARALAVQNQLTEDEIDSVELGYWDKTSSPPGFVAALDPTTNRYLAVRVKAHRNVPLDYGRVLGWKSFRTPVLAVAKIGGVSEVDCMIPFGIENSYIQNIQYGQSFNVSVDSPGNWGKLDIGGNMSSGTNFFDAMRNNICVKTKIGDHISPGTGNGQLQQGWNARYGRDPIVIIPIVTGFNNGNSQTVTVVGFVIAEMTGQTGNGANWSGNLVLLDTVIPSVSDGPIIDPYSKGRYLMQ